MQTESHARHYVNQTLVDHMDIFCCCTDKLKEIYGHRTSQLHTPEQSVRYQVALANGEWAQEFTGGIKRV